MRILISSLFCLLLVNLANCQQTYEVLWIGNSYTGANNLPLITKNIAISVGDNITDDYNTPGGYRLMNHSSNSTTLSKIRSKNWDFVSIQAQSQEPSWPDGQVQTEVFPHAKILSDSIRANNGCSQPVFYMTWGRKTGDASNCGGWPPVCTYEGMDSILHKNYLQMGFDNKALVSPVGAVWRHLRQNTPSLDLYSGDGSHPSPAGSYAAAVTFFTIFSRKNPSLIPYDYTLPALDASEIRAAVETVVYDSLSKWGVGLYDHNLVVELDACDSLEINGQVYYSDTSYTDTLIGLADFGCDSTINYDFSIGSSIYTPLSFQSCNPIVSPSGNHSWDSSGTYLDTLFALQGCDTILSVEVSIFQGNFDSISISSCTPLPAPSGDFIMTHSGLWNDTLQNISGCDSILYIDLIILESTTSFLWDTVCDGLTSPSGDFFWENSGLYLDTVSNTAGCDSIISIDLTVYQTEHDTIIETSCEEYVSPSGNHTWTQSGLWSDTLTNGNNCDSIINVDLLILNQSDTTISDTSCSPYISPSGNNVWQESGLYTDQMVNLEGCDSIIQINLTISEVNTTLIDNSPVLSSNSIGAVYQWIDCNTNSPIPGENSETFVATSNGNYGLIITENNCTDTSECIEVTNVGISLENLIEVIEVYPNPSNGTFYIQNNYSVKISHLIIRDLFGKIIFEKKNIEENNYPFSLSTSKGIYFLEILMKDGKRVSKRIEKS